MRIVWSLLFVLCVVLTGCMMPVEEEFTEIGVEREALTWNLSSCNSHDLRYGRLVGYHYLAVCCWSSSQWNLILWTISPYNGVQDTFNLSNDADRFFYVASSNPLSCHLGAYTYPVGGTDPDWQTGFIVNGLDGDDSITLADGDYSGGIRSPTHLAMEAYGGDGGDNIRGGEYGDRIYGGADDDGLYGNEGTDLIYGNGGSDYIYGDDGHDVLYGGGSGEQSSDVDWVYGGLGNDTITGRWNSFLFGEGSNDTIDGTDGQAYIHGGWHTWGDTCTNGALYVDCEL